MKAAEIRRRFLDFFESKGHRPVESSPLVPRNDPTLLFVNAGMNQFKDVFLGLEKRDYRRAATVQKCVRAGGKHNDLENVGVTARHHTFFEMLGNFSFGDYFKKEAIDLAWELLVEHLKLDPARLAVTIFEGDSAVPRDAEAFAEWRRYFAAERIHELGREDNFWSMGDTGPCGPCSEVHFFQGDRLPCSAPKCLGVACECDRWLEIWNLVFMQFDRAADGSLTPLPAPSVDTGMGLERITAIVQRVESNYDTDLFAPLLGAIAARTGRVYHRSSSENDVSFRVIADHIRATTFLITDGVMPQNEGRGYVLRKIMRRAMRHGKKLGVQEPFLVDLVGTVVEEMKGAYPELVLSKDFVERVVRSEEDRFRTTLTQAIAALEEMLATEEVARTKTLGGSAAFKLYDTFGMPLDLAVDIAAESGVRVDEAGFEREMDLQRTRARDSWKKSAAAPDRGVYGAIRGRVESRFEGYGETQLADVRIVALTRNGAEVRELREGDEGEVFLDATPFYPEGGGQVGDRGVLAGPDGMRGGSWRQRARGGPHRPSGEGVAREPRRRSESERPGGRARARRRGLASHPHSHAPCRSPRDPRPARQAGGLARRAQPAPLRFLALRAAHSGRDRADRGEGHREDSRGHRSRDRGPSHRRSARSAARLPSSERSTGRRSAWSGFPTSVSSSAAGPISGARARRVFSSS